MVSSEFTYIAESVYQLNDEKQSWKKKKKKQSWVWFVKKFRVLAKSKHSIIRMIGFKLRSHHVLAMDLRQGTCKMGTLSA